MAVASLHLRKWRIIQSMSGKPAVLGLAACLLLLQAATTLPAAAAEPPTSTDPSPNLKPADSSTPTVAARDSDDLRITAQIRQALLADKSFSLLAQRVQIATNQDAVILRGAVLSNELNRIESLAAQYAGSRQIDNQLTVAAQ
jgi:hyperosmotically inducible periplasmic protein